MSSKHLSRHSSAEHYLIGTQHYKLSQAALLPRWDCCPHLEETQTDTSVIKRSHKLYVYISAQLVHTALVLYEYSMWCKKAESTHMKC